MVMGRGITPLYIACQSGKSSVPVQLRLFTNCLILKELQYQMIRFVQKRLIAKRIVGDNMLLYTKKIEYIYTHLQMSVPQYCRLSAFLDEE